MGNVAALDIGSTRINVAIPAVASTSDYFTKGLKIGRSKVIGFRNGHFSDTSILIRSIKSALEQAESAAGVKVEAAYIGFPGYTVEFNEHRFGSLIGRGRRVTGQDICRIKRLAHVWEFPAGRRLIHLQPLEYFADGGPVGQDPLGIYCSRLEMNSLAITADSRFLEQIEEAVYGSGIKTEEFLPSPLAVGGALLKPVQMQIGTVLIDFGGQCTSIVFYNHGQPKGFNVLPIGSDHITSDLAICLRTTLEGAEEVKRNIGMALNKDGLVVANDVAEVSVPRLSGAGFNKVPVEMAVRIIKARVYEILDMVSESISNLAGTTDLPGGLVFAGGGSILKGLQLFSSEYLGVKIQMGVKDNFGDNISAEKEDSELAVKMAGAVGLLKHFSGASDSTPLYHQPSSGIWRKVRGIFRVSK